jgi:hypothetical protein
MRLLCPALFVIGVLSIGTAEVRAQSYEGGDSNYYTREYSPWGVSGSNSLLAKPGSISGYPPAYQRSLSAAATPVRPYVGVRPAAPIVVPGNSVRGDPRAYTYGQHYGTGYSPNYFGAFGQGYGIGYSRSYFGNPGQQYGTGFSPKY